MDVVLVLVVALCTLETDIIHAVYLALALLLFRQRDVVRNVGNGMFVWLVACNFAVNLAKIMYQAPVPLLFKDKWDFTADLVRDSCPFLPSFAAVQYFLSDDLNEKICFIRCVVQPAFSGESPEFGGFTKIRRQRR